MDIKEQFPFEQYEERNIKGKIFHSEELKNEDKTRAYFVYKALTNKSKGLKADRKASPFDPDNSTGKCKFTRDLYSKLWGFEKCPRSNFGEISAFKEEQKKIIFGGDCLNSLQTSINAMSGYTTIKCINKMVEDKETFLNEMENSEIANLFKVSHAPGNFGLVPAYFNGFRGRNSDIKDYLPQSLFYLMNMLDEKISLNRNQKKYIQKYPIGKFKKYVNTMFLWDLVKYESDGSISVINYSGDTISSSESNYKIMELSDWAKGAERFIRRRGIFMGAMLYASYFHHEDFKKITEALYVDDIKVNNTQDGSEAVNEDGKPKDGYEAAFELITKKIEGNKELSTVFECAKEAIDEL